MCARAIGKSLCLMWEGEFKCVRMLRIENVCEGWVEETCMRSVWVCLSDWVKERERVLVCARVCVFVCMCVRVCVCVCVCVSDVWEERK